jgi:predicted GNAT superfamily acetyltransferase
MTSPSSVAPTPTLGAPNATALSLDATAAGVHVRMLQSNHDFSRCVELQREIWGFDQAEIVPATFLHVVEYAGGLVAGAFDSNDELLGFVLGITGIHDGELSHWSHMLGVRESARNIGVGRMLKEYQRAYMASLGVAHIAWTFDPLQAKNAHFNINRLGAAVVRYVPDMYGTTASPLHLGMATDRLIARVTTSPSTSPNQPLTLPGEAGIPILSPFGRPTDTAFAEDRRPEVVLIEMPTDVLAVLGRSPAEAQAWRFGVREHFQRALALGYVVRGVHRAADGDRAFYIMKRSLNVA